MCRYVVSDDQYNTLGFEQCDIAAAAQRDNPPRRPGERIRCTSTKPFAERRGSMVQVKKHTDNTYALLHGGGSTELTRSEWEQAIAALREAWEAEHEAHLLRRRRIAQLLLNQSGTAFRDDAARALEMIRESGYLRPGDPGYESVLVLVEALAREGLCE